MAKKKKKAKAAKTKPKKKAAKAAKKAAKAEKKAQKRAAASRLSWLDDAGSPRIDDHARKLESFVRAMADGKVDPSEINDQEKRLVKLMKKVEPLLDNDLHAQVTELMCELTAYDFMQTVYSMQEARDHARLEL